jgi:hypothetical protein
MRRLAHGNPTAAARSKRPDRRRQRGLAASVELDRRLRIGDFGFQPARPRRRRLARTVRWIGTIARAVAASTPSPFTRAAKAAAWAAAPAASFSVTMRRHSSWAAGPPADIRNMRRAITRWTSMPSRHPSAHIFQVIGSPHDSHISGMLPGGTGGIKSGSDPGRSRPGSFTGYGVRGPLGPGRGFSSGRSGSGRGELLMPRQRLNRAAVPRDEVPASVRPSGVSA